MGDDDADDRPWYRRWDGQPAWFDSRTFQERPWAKRLVRWQPALIVIGIPFSVLGLFLGQPSLVLSGLTPLIMRLAIPSNRGDC